MSMPRNPGRDSRHAPEEAVRWFSQWHVYRSIVDADWMAHRGIFTAIRAWVLMRHPGPFALADLGCGDAGFIKPTFDETGLWAYTGVDASQAALSKARGELAGARFAVELLESDLLTFLREDAGPAAQRFDVVLASYAVHHLPAREKHEFFRLVHGKLRPHGSLLFADVFRRDGESREDYLDRYVGMMRQAWKGMPPEHVAGTIEHVVQRDFPESGETISGMASEGGFCELPRELFRDATAFHRLLAFTKVA